MFFSSCAVVYTHSPRYRRVKMIEQPLVSQISRTSHPLEEKKGKLPWPVSGEVVGRFGVQVDPKYGTKTKNLGIDIATKEGSVVRTIGVGRVSYADVFIGQGIMVIVEHGGGFYSVYSRLKELRVKSGDNVNSGDIVGLSGNVVHFELRIGGKAVDPLEWLERR